MLLVAPLTRLGGPRAYQIITLLNVACMVIGALLFPLRFSRPRPFSALLALIFLTGLFGYGVQFELERGQLNLIAATLAFVALWLFHLHPRWRYLAYGLFTLAVQLKIYPFIFIVLLVSDWRAWRRNGLRFAGLAGVNLAALFVFGPRLVPDFLLALADHAANPYLWFGNHSVRSFAAWLPTRALWAWLTPYAGPLEFALLALVAVCLGLLLLQAYRRRLTGLNPFLLLACALGALTIPSASHDYTLSILAAPVAVFLTLAEAGPRAPGRARPLLSLALLVVFSAAYATTLFSYATKPQWLYHNFPALLIMLLCTTALAFISPWSPAITPRPS